MIVFQHTVIVLLYRFVIRRNKIFKNTNQKKILSESPVYDSQYIAPGTSRHRPASILNRNPESGIEWIYNSIQRQGRSQLAQPWHYVQYYDVLY